jgi:RNA polymerase sigma-70 factor (ECF subfamily)
VSDRAKLAVASGDGRMSELFENLQAGDDLVEQFDQEFRRGLMDQAVAFVRPRVSPRMWDAFRLTALEGCSGASVAAQLDMTVSHVYVAKSKVRKLIREEVRRLEASE